MTALIGAKPVPPATSSIGLADSSRRKKLPCRPLMRSRSRSFMAVNTWSVKCPSGTRRTCSCRREIVVGGIGQGEATPPPILEQDVNVLSGQKLQAFAGRRAA